MNITNPTAIRSFIQVRTTTAHGQLAIVTLHPGSLTYPTLIDTFGREVRQYASSLPGTDFVIDFHQVHYISSTVLTELLKLKQVVDATGGCLRICGLHKNAREIFAITKLDHVFCLQPDLRHALRQYDGPERVQPAAD